MTTAEKKALKAAKAAAKASVKGQSTIDTIINSENLQPTEPTEPTEPTGQNMVQFFHFATKESEVAEIEVVIEDEIKTEPKKQRKTWNERNKLVYLAGMPEKYFEDCQKIDAISKKIWDAYQTRDKVELNNLINGLNLDVLKGFVVCIPTDRSFGGQWAVKNVLGQTEVLRIRLFPEKKSFILSIYPYVNKGENIIRYYEKYC